MTLRTYMWFCILDLKYKYCTFETTPATEIVKSECRGNQLIYFIDLIPFLLVSCHPNFEFY